MTGYAWHDVLGNIGVLLILGTYAALQAGRIAADAMAYSVCNALGAGLVTLSLLFEFNLSAFVIETAWVVVSVYGIVRVARRRARSPGDA